MWYHSYGEEVDWQRFMWIISFTNYFSNKNLQYLAPPSCLEILYFLTLEFVEIQEWKEKIDRGALSKFHGAQGINPLYAKFKSNDFVD